MRPLSRPPSRLVLSILLVFCGLASAGLARAQWDGYGELARTTALTAADDYRIGKGYFDMVGWMYGTVSDPKVTEKVDRIVRRVVTASDRPDLVFNVVVVPSPDINAAALPGGFLMVNQGLLDALTDDEIAFVLAHEVSHVQLRHFATTLNMNQAMSVLDQGSDAQAAGDKAGVEASLDALQKLSMSYARNLELEADLYGMLYALRAGWPSRSGVAAMGHMRDLVGEIPPGMEDLSTHPKFSDRIGELEKGLETITETYAMFDAGVAYARAGSYEAAIPSFQQFLALFPRSAAGWSNLGTCYLHEAIESDQQDPWFDDLPLYIRPDVAVRSAGVDRVMLERARDAFAKAIGIDPNRDAAHGSLGVVARLEGDFDGAKALIEKAIQLDKDYAGHHNNLGNVFAGKGDWKGAEREWKLASSKDKSMLAARANQAVSLASRKKTKEAVEIWQSLEGEPAWALHAYDALVALGAPTKERERPLEEQEEVASLIGLIAMLGTGEETGVEGGVEGGVPVESGSYGASGEDAKVGAVELGQSRAKMKEALGAPDYEDVQLDGYYAYLHWSTLGLSAVFTDDVAMSLEVFAPSQLKTGRGVGVGSTRAEVDTAYGGAEYSYRDEATGTEALTWDSRGTGIYFDAAGAVTALNVWRY
jgi:predicted Zn-dependent protease